VGGGVVSLLLRDARDRAGARLDVRIADGVITEAAADLRVRDEEVIDCGGGVVLPGLHDHHLHLLATAAHDHSVRCGPPAVHDPSELRRALIGAVPTGGWVRGTDYDESVAGLPDRAGLDALRHDVPVRIQHRSGALWLLNSAALRAIGADAGPVGVERDTSGRPTGRLWRADDWLRSRLPDAGPPPLRTLSRRLAGYGITGVTDATPDLDADALVTLAAARASGDLLQRVVVLGTDDPDPRGVDGSGPRKVVVADHDLPTLSDLTDRFRAARGNGRRALAVHCVSREALLLTLAALSEVGSRPGDRIEHAAVVPPVVRGELRRLGLTVVTQPSLIAARGDDYLARVDPDDLAGLWPFRSLLEANIPVGCSSDAPYGDPDPWISLRTAARRAAPSGALVTASESVDAATALRGYLTSPAAPGGRTRRIVAGAPADLVVLDGPLIEALGRPDHRRVQLTLIDGQPIR
jgi:predicted amidohydrolase YtcJ